MFNGGAGLGDQVIIGIDLGTTNCACAVYRNGEIEMIPNSLGHVLTPSAVSVDDEKHIITGLPARERQATHPDRTVTSFKRYMGAKHVTQLGNLTFSPEELSALMLRSLKADAEAYLGEPVEEAVITVPAYFNDKQRKATKRAGELADLKVERLINEPTAAALAYGLHKRGAETRFLVFDLGGGTFDVSILEIFEGVIEVRATSGDTRLGGEDFNEVLIEMARAKFAKEIGSALKDDNALYQRLRESAERTRRALTNASDAPFSFVWKNKEWSFNVSADQYETQCDDLLARLREPVLRSLRDSNIAIESLSDILLVGGATRMPIVRRAVTKMFGRFPSTNINPDEAVAQGAAVQAALKARHSDLKEVVLTDVCPYTLGVESTEKHGGEFVKGIFVPILERNCVVPASREKEFGTLADYQTAVKFNIYQGESRWVKDNVLLGDVTIPVPPARAGEHPIECRFSYDINGLLEVDLHVPESGVHRQLVIVDRDGVTPAQLEQRRKDLAKLKVHPRDSDAVRATLARAGRCYENAIGQERDELGHVIGRFEAVVEAQDPREVEAARKELEAILDRMEGRSFL